jgi:hypothetical protein
MRRALFLASAALIVVAVTASGALAKGLMGKAKVEGKGLKGPITFRFDEGDHHDDDFFTLIGETGLIDGWNGTTPYDWTDAPPTNDLGTRYTITWDLQQFEGPDVHVVQYLYPYAKDGPLVYTPAGGRVMGSNIPTGWYEAPFALNSHLESLGFPDTDPDAAPRADSGATKFAAESSNALAYILAAITVAVLGLGVMASRRAPRAARSS